MSDAWNEMLDEFRALGGTADNICLKQGPLGRGLFPVDQTKPVHIHIPENLLIDSADVFVEDGRFRVSPNSPAGARERAFLENYENAFSWGSGGHADVERFLESMQALPETLRGLLADKFGLGVQFEDATPAFVLSRFLAARIFGYHGRSVVMPIIELANHGDGSSYGDAGGISLSGQFPGEVLVRYSSSDPLQIFMTWGFATDSPLALSIGGSLNTKAGKVVVIERKFEGQVRVTKGQPLWIPEVAIDGDQATLQYLMIGNRQFPRLSKGIFYRLMRDAGFVNVEETFDVIQHMNRMHFLELIGALEGHEGPMIRTLRDMARFQLQAMSHCYGVREV
ncbi:MAG TPA: hypothetical protein VIM02_01805 [Rhizomicrobium sp.]|jgi:hypothetical protein